MIMVFVVAVRSQPILFVVGGVSGYTLIGVDDLDMCARLLVVDRCRDRGVGRSRTTHHHDGLGRYFATGQLDRAVFKLI